MKKTFNIILMLALLLAVASACGEKQRLFVSGYNKPGQNGMTVFEFNSGDGKLTLLGQADVGPAPSYFCYSSKNRLMYVINEVMEFRGEFGGGLTTYHVDEKGIGFEKKSEMLTPYGGPCYISMSPDSAYLFIASYPNGSVSVVRLGPDGIPAEITDTILYYPEEPDRSHAHMILAGPSGKRIYVTDLGLNRIMIYDFDKTSGKLNLIEDGIEPLPQRFGPRHFAFSGDGKKMYVINELGSKIMVFDVSDNGNLRVMQTLPTIPPTFIDNNYCADIHLGAGGKFLYGSNRGENTIVVFRVENDGTLTFEGRAKCGGNWPRNFTLDPSGKFLLAGNQKSDTVSVFRLDSETGMPQWPPQQYPVKTPACLKFY